MKKLLVMMLMVLGICVGSFAKDSSFTKSKTEPMESKEHALYMGLINQLTRECASMGRATQLACDGLLAKYEEHFLELRGLGDGYFISNLKEDDLAYIYKVLSKFVMDQFYSLNPKLNELTEEEKVAYNNFLEQLDVCRMTSKEDKKFVGCK